MITVNTWLPVFPGFYGTFFEPDEENEMDSINSERHSLGLPEIKDSYAFEFDYTEYYNQVAKECTRIVQSALEDIGFTVKFSFQKVVSSREYNFANDSIDVEVKFTKATWKKIRKYLKENVDSFKKYLLSRYKSRDGFSSWYSYYPEDWNLPIDDLDNVSHKVGSILQFILENEGFFYEDLYESCNDIYLLCENYDELVNAFVCEECDTIITAEDSLREYNEQLEKESAKMRSFGVENFSVKSFAQWSKENPITCECEGE